ncbi:MAG: ComEA family DNA-binding protein [Acidimicrobiia bacterium]|jgi:competence protein ComEA|nr:MAG: ComEA family DNA-binding protein [Acidimicrobiia bacterium]
MASRPALVVLALALLGAGVVGWGLGGRGAGTVPTPVVVEPVAAPIGVLVVHVGGAVANPGLVELPDDARVADAIRAAGGLLEGAAIDAVNLARPLSDGEQVVVPIEGRDVVVGSVPGRVRVNAATQGELEALPGVGPVLAGRIISHREEFGPFREVEDLLVVPGIGERMLASLRDLVEVP